MKLFTAKIMDLFDCFHLQRDQIIMYRFFGTTRQEKVGIYTAGNSKSNQIKPKTLSLDK